MKGSQRKKVHPVVSKYMSNLAKKRKKMPKEHYQKMQKKSVIARRKKLLTGKLAK